MKVKKYGALLVSVLMCSPFALAKKPNVLLIVADDVGFSDIQPFGSEIQTPNLQKLAQQGATLSNFYSGPTCSVTRSMLLTGQDNHQVGMGTMAELLQPEHEGNEGYQGVLNHKAATLAEILHQNGYQSFMSGKWHLGKKPELIPSARGFDQSFVLLQGGAGHFDETPLLLNYDPIYLENGKKVSLPNDFYSTDYYTNKMLNFLETSRDKEKPFFAYLALTSAHWPLQAPDQYIEKYKGQYKDGYEAIRQNRLARLKQQGIIPQNTQANNPFEQQLKPWEALTTEQQARETKAMQVYAAMIDNMDANIGKILNYLKEKNELDNTIVLFISDNGPEVSDIQGLDESDGFMAWVNSSFDNSLENMGRKGSYIALGPQWAQVAATPYPYTKGFLADGGIHVPAIMSYPKKIPAGIMKNENLHVMDFVPTVLDYAGIRHVQQDKSLKFEGVSFANIFKNKQLKNRTLNWEFNNRKVIHDRNWVLLEQAKPYGTGTWQLFNRDTDPAMKVDVAQQFPEQVTKMSKQWQQYAKRVGVVEAPARYNYTQRICFYGDCIGQPEK